MPDGHASLAPPPPAPTAPEPPAAPEKPAAPAATRFGPYELVRKLGEGGMGIVYEARRVGLQKRVAIKVLTCFEGHGATARFLQEARIAASIDHPHAVDCIDLGQHEGVPYLAMEFLDGETLRERLGRGPLGVEEAVGVMLPVMSAIAAAHDLDVVHRDLKPENIFLANRLGDTVPKVLDFGIAKSSATAGGPGITHTSAIIGTPGYMAPEQAIDSKRVTPASDQFALGAVLWACVAGQELYLGDAMIEVLFAVVHEPPRDLRVAAPGAPAGFCAAVMRMLARAPEERFPSVREAARALLPYAPAHLRARWEREFGAAPAPEAPPAPAPSPAPRGTELAAAPALATPEAPDAPPPRRPPLLVGLAVAAALASALALVATRRSPARAAPVVPAASLASPALAPAPVAAPAPAPVAAPAPAPALAAPAPSPVAAPPPAPQLPAAPRVPATSVRPPAHHPHLRHRNL